MKGVEIRIIQVTHCSFFCRCISSRALPHECASEKPIKLRIGDNAICYRVAHSHLKGKYSFVNGFQAFVLQSHSAILPVRLKQLRFQSIKGGRCTLEVSLESFKLIYRQTGILKNRITYSTQLITQDIDVSGIGNERGLTRDI